MQVIEPRFLCIIGIPRTGTNYLCSLLARISGVRARNEIFHDIGAMSLLPSAVDALGIAAQRIFSGWNDPALTAWMRRHPAVAIRTIIRAPNSRPTRLLSFKVFPGHLPVPKISGQLMSIPRIRFLIVKRRIIDSYISLLKARQIGRWEHVDTTSLRVVIDPVHFVRYVDISRGWYERISAALTANPKPHKQLIYEEFATNGDDKLTAHLVHMLHDLGFREVAGRNVQNTRPLERQDRAATYQDKVVNWAEFIDDPLVRSKDIDLFGYF